jgi:hypothetical protein
VLRATNSPHDCPDRRHIRRAIYGLRTLVRARIRAGSAVPALQEEGRTMTGLVPKAVHLAAIAAIVAASVLMLSDNARAADGKPTRSQQAKGLCSFWQSADPSQYKECLKRNR